MLAAPLTGATIGALLGSAGTAARRFPLPWNWLTSTQQQAAPHSHILRITPGSNGYVGYSFAKKPTVGWAKQPCRF